MRINWFPGHMNKARREIREAMRRTDVVIEVLDARMPRSSSNPMLERLAGRVPVIHVLAKSDLADPEVTRAWVRFFEQRGRRCMPLVASRKADAARVLGECRDLAAPRRRSGRPIAAMVVGIPNVGKSTLLNSLAGRKLAAVENRPAVTQRQQRVDAGDDVVVMDTPGVLWPRLEDLEGANRLAVSGAIKEAVIELESIARYGLGLLTLHYPARLSERYGLDVASFIHPVDEAKVPSRRPPFVTPTGEQGVGGNPHGNVRSRSAAAAPSGESTADAELAAEPADTLDLLGAFDVVGALEQQRGVDTFGLLEQLGRNRGCLLRGNEIDREKAARLFLTDLRGGKLGAVSFDRPVEKRLILPRPPERVVRQKPAAEESLRPPKARGRAGARGSTRRKPGAPGKPLASPARSGRTAAKAARSPKPAKAAARPAARAGRKAASPKLSLKKRARG